MHINKNVKNGFLKNILKSVLNYLKIDVNVSVSKYQKLSMGHKARFRNIYDGKTFRTTSLSIRTPVYTSEKTH